MFKKMIAAMLAISVLVAMWIVPSKASSFSDTPFFNVDFNSGTFNDVSNGLIGEEVYFQNPEEPLVQTVEFVEDEGLGRTVARFHGESAIFYNNFDYPKIMTNFTMEAYVKVPARQDGWGYIAGSYWQNNPSAGICFTYGAHTLAGVGANMAYNVIQGNGKLAPSGTDTNSSTIKGSKLSTGDWMHLVYVHDGVTEAYYENGQLKSSRAVWQANIPSVTDDQNKAFRIGGYNRVSQFCANMDCAYVRVYASAADATDVATLYTNRLAAAPTPGPATPSPAPTEAPSGTIFEVDFSTGSAADVTGHYTLDVDSLDTNWVEIQHDDELDSDVAVFSNWGGIYYTSNGLNLYNYDLTQGIAVEAYIKVDDAAHNMTFIETTGSALHLQQYNDSTDHSVGFRCGDKIESYYNMQNAYSEEILPANTWKHLLGVSDGQTNRFYIDGQLVASVNRNSALLNVPEGNTNNTRLCLGESVFGGMWGNTNMEGKIAFARIYVNSFTDEEAAELYYAVNPSARPTAEPTAEPTPEPTPAGYTVSGTVTSFNSDTDDVTVQLIPDGESQAAYETSVQGKSAAYAIENVTPGDYALRVTKNTHVAREYAITVTDQNVTQDAKIHLLGDLNGDGKITVLDVGKANSHAKGVKLLTGYELSCADTFKSDGKVTAADVGRMNAHAKGTSLLW